MCKYCDVKSKHVYQGDFGMLVQGESEVNIAESRFESCKIEILNGKYVIGIGGMDADFSEPINYCPFCGRELNKE